MKVITPLSLAIVLSLTSAFTNAQIQIPPNQQQHAFRLNVGHQSRYTRVEVAYETPTLWQGNLFRHPIDLKVEAGIAHWNAHSLNNYSLSFNHTNSNLWQIGVTPMLRWWVNNHWYIEGGIGLNLMSNTHFANKRMSTAFQFGDHIGIVRTFGENWRAGLRLSHFSNGSIKRPNDGLNIFQLTIARTF